MRSRSRLLDRSLARFASRGSRAIGRGWTRVLRDAVIWVQCALLLVGVPGIAAADGQDGSTSKATRDPSVTRGQSSGVFDVMTDAFTGAARLAYPIEVAPGTNGAEPTI